jgi:hypothetical protein
MDINVSIPCDNGRQLVMNVSKARTTKVLDDNHSVVGYVPPLTSICYEKNDDQWEMVGRPMSMSHKLDAQQCIGRVYRGTEKIVNF